MNTNSIFSRFCHSRIPHFAVVTLIILAWSSLAFCDEFHDAILNDNLEKVKALLKANPDLVFSIDTNNSGYTPLHEAAMMNRPDLVALLLANKADVNAKGEKGVTVLHEAAVAGRMNVVELLLAHNADVDAREDDGATPLFAAVVGGHRDVVGMLVAHKADVNARDKKGNTPLFYAAAMGHEDVAELLRKHGGHE